VFSHDGRKQLEDDPDRDHDEGNLAKRRCGETSRGLTEGLFEDVAAAARALRRLFENVIRYEIKGPGMSGRRTDAARPARPALLS
jgi:hypothetical protein